MSTQRKYFGTDGMRGKANVGHMTPEIVMRLARAAGQAFREENPNLKPSVVIGKDTRLSGYMLESALEAGFTSAGFYCLLVGPMPTPAVAMLTRSLRANLGVMISASHNPYEDNGIKLFAGDGFKLPDAQELAIEAAMDGAMYDVAEPDEIGRAVRIDDAAGRYIEFCKNALPKDFTLDGLKVVVDCAHGATYQIAPRIFWELGAEVIRIGASPNGVNINDGCGSTHPETMQQAVKDHGADLGIALDGDGDRVILCDENGVVIDGDQLLAAIALDWHQRGILRGDTVVATQMSNMGFEMLLKEKGLQMVRTKVGDRYVVEAMRANDYNLGGEQSGHVVCIDHATTGDGIIAALQFLLVMKEQQAKASELGETFTPYPQTLQNVRIEGVDADSVLALAVVKETIDLASQELGDNGRVLIRKSGTEPVIRVMVEAKDVKLRNQCLARIVDIIESHKADAA